MRMRSALPAWAGVLVVAGAAAGTPPGVAGDQDEGRVPAQVVREFHGSAAGDTPAGFQVSAPRPIPATPAWAGEMIAGMRKALFGQLTMPLGTVPIED